jgi:hypothetical protein
MLIGQDGHALPKGDPLEPDEPHVREPHFERRMLIVSVVGGVADAERLSMS